MVQSVGSVIVLAVCCESGLGFDGLVNALVCVFQNIARSRAVGVEAVMVGWVAGRAPHDATDGEATYGALDEFVHVGCLA